MWGRYLILGFVLAGGGAGGGLAGPPVPLPVTTAPHGQEPDPDAAAEVDAEASDPFAQFDLGVASLARSDTVSEWTELAASGLVLVPETVEVRAGQTIDSLLIDRGVRPDPYARSLVAEINPNLSEAFALAAGDSVTLFQVHRPEGGPFASGRVALQSFQAEREAVRRQLEALAELTPSGDARPSGLDRFRMRIERAESRVVLTHRSQIEAQRFMLQSFNSQVNAWTASASYERDRAEYEAIARLTNATVADIRRLPGDKRRASIRIRFSSTGAGPSGPCEVGWAPLGFAPHKSSRVFERYQDDVVIRVPASALHVWIARSQDTPPTTALRRVQKTQLIDGDTLAMTIPTPGRCVP